MKFFNDIRHVARSAAYGMRTRPSRITEKQKYQQMQQAAWRRAKAGVVPNMYYPGADTGVLRNDWSTSVKSATQVIRDEFKKLCARSELAYRTDPWARRALQVLTTFIVGQGIKPYPAVKMYNGEMVDGINSVLAEHWQRFNDQGIRNGPQQMTVYDAMRLNMTTIGVYGNCLMNTVSSRPGSWLRYAMQFIKPTRLDFGKDNYWDSSNYEIKPNPFIVHGIEINGYGEPQKFHLENQSPIGADRMSISYYPIETECYLGLPWLTQVLESVWDSQQLRDDKMKQSRIGAKLGYRIQRTDQDAFIAAADSTSDSGSEYVDLDFQGFVATENEITAVKADDTLKESFEPLVKLGLIQLGAGLGFSYQCLTTDLEGMNFASSRANILNDNRFFRTVFKWYTKDVLQRWWEKFVEWEVLQGKIPGLSYQVFMDDPWYYTQCYWLPMDGEEWVDPLKDAESMKLLYGLGQVTYQEICSMAGKDWRNVLKQIAKEREEMKSLGLEDLVPNQQETNARRLAMAKEKQGDEE